MSYLKQHGTKQTPQHLPIPGSTQVENSAGGYAWQVSCWTRLRRFLILGCEGGSYYAGEHDLTRENVSALNECIAEDGVRTVNEIVFVSDGGLAPKNDQAIYALAACSAANDPVIRKAALAALPKVCRIGTHLFQFATFAELFRGWGRGLRTAIGAWYQQPNVGRLAYQAVKYRQRDGWSHRDLLRLAHPTAPSEEHAALYDFITHGTATEPAQDIIQGYLDVNRDGAMPYDIARSIRAVGLPREALPTDALKEALVWEALLENMPLTAMIRNLGNMSRIGLLTPTSLATGDVIAKLGDADHLRRSRVHPLSVLVAQKTYASGRGFRGKGEWSPVPQIVDALNDAFYASFPNVESTGKRYLLALDVSSSMRLGSVAGSPLNPKEAAAAMALVTANSETYYECTVFQTSLLPYPLSPRQRLDDVVKIPWSGGGTDCALPMLYAISLNREVDVFVVYTDSETWAGKTVHPAQALAEYRRQSGIDAKLIVVGMVSNGFSIADPDDPGMLDVVGFDTATPQIMAEFAKGSI